MAKKSRDGDVYDGLRLRSKEDFSHKLAVINRVISSSRDSIVIKCDR
ncbi:hypothetical protein [Nostoc sp.]